MPGNGVPALNVARCGNRLLAAPVWRRDQISDCICSGVRATGLDERTGAGKYLTEDRFIRHDDWQAGELRFEKRQSQSFVV